MLFLKHIIDNKSIKVLLLFVILDTLFGILRAIKYKKINSAIGIDGIVRKAGMILSVIFFKLIDFTINIDLISFIPETIKNSLNIQIGSCELFGIIFIVFEFLSVLKNMSLCKLPIPKKLQVLLDKLLKEFTEEIKKEG